MSYHSEEVAPMVSLPTKDAPLSKMKILFMLVGTLGLGMGLGYGLSNHATGASASASLLGIDRCQIELARSIEQITEFLEMEGVGGMVADFCI